MKHIFEKKTRIPAPASRVFAWHEEPGTLARLIPPGDPVRIVEHRGGIRDGATVLLRMGYPPFTIDWLAVHRNYCPGRRFEDVQGRGPFAFWRHTHFFWADGGGACILHDHMEFELPFSPWSEMALPFVRRKLERTFQYRHRVTLEAISVFKGR